MTDPVPILLVIEDEAQMRRFLRASLTNAGYQLIETETAEQGLVQAAAQNPDLVLLDLGLPDLDGLHVTERLRQWAKMPIIVISARGQEQDKIKALDAGADDYLTKPFGVDELLARIRVALRHARDSQTNDELPLEFANVRIDLARREVRVGDREIHLTPTEYKMLSLLARNAGRVLTHRQIIREVWGPSYAGQNHHVRVHMAELRKKIEPDPARPKLIITEPGVGYRLRD